MQHFILDSLSIISSEPEEIRLLLKSQLANGSEPYQIVTFNLDFYRIASQNKRFYRLCKEAGLIVPDGFGVTSLLKLKYGKSINRITGTDMFRFILEQSKETVLRVALVGSSEEVLNSLSKKLKSAYPKLIISCRISPAFNFEKNNEENEKIIQEIKRSSPDVLFLALGCPRQEFWLAENKEKIGAKINIGIGSVFDTYSGLKKRAPLVFQKYGFEWFYRLISEPKRLSRRYIINDIPFYIKQVLRILRENANKTE